MSDLSDWNVLVVDDEPDNIGVIELVLGFHQARVRTASSGQACLAMMREEIPTLLLLDIQMPEMSGFELLAIVRTTPDWAHIPAIAVTAHAMRGDEERIIESGFDGYIPKPVNALSLADELVEMLKIKEKK